MPFHSFFEEIFLILQVPHNNIVVMAVFIALHVLVVILRTTVFMNYRGQNLWLARELHPARALKSPSDAGEIRSPLLRRITTEYIAAAEKNAPRVPLDAIIDKHILALSLAGWRYSGIGRWIETLDNSLILLGLVLALVFPDYAIVYGLLAISGFVLLKIAAAFFDYNTARQLLAGDIHLYVEREVGQFFAGHTAGAILKFKDEMAEAMDRQSVLLRGAVENLSADLIPALNHLECLANLPKALENMQQSNDRYAVHHEAFMSQAELIKNIQAALESSLASYETTLQNLIQDMGNGLGTFIQMHGQTATTGMTEALQAHIARAAEGNQETITAMTALVNQLTAQNRDISAHLRTLHERIDDR